MNTLQWYQRLHWRGAFSFIVLFIVIETPIWMFVRTLDFTDPARAVERGLGLATLGAIATILLHTIAARSYLTRRMSASRRALLGSVADERMMSRFSDEIALLANDVAATMNEMRARLVRLQQERTRLETLLAGLGDAILMVDDAERVLVANVVAEKLLQLPKNYVGKRLTEVCHAPRLNAAVAEVLWAHERASVDIDVSKRSEVHHLSVTVSPIMTDANIAGAVVVLHDLTQLRRLERVRRDFVANVSHELRTPIASIRSAAETLQLAHLGLKPEYDEFLRTIERNAERMGTIVEDLLVLSRLEAAGEEITLHAVNLAGVFAEIIDHAEPIAGEHGVGLTVEMDEDLPQIYAERGALRQIVQNLVENAIKYTPGGGRVTVSARRKGKKRVRIEVSDTGPGIPEEHLPRIFERFYRVDMGRSRQIGGTGLGLAIVKHLVRKLKGRIEVDSAPEEGTTFTLTLRVYRPEKADQ